LFLGLDIADNIAFLGYQDNPYKYMKRASVFVLSSLQEGFGNVIVEAMACGAPVVATDCKSGPGEIIQDGINGLLVPVQDEEALAAAMLKILENPALAETLSSEGKKRAEFFSVKNSAQKYGEVFQELVKITVPDKIGIKTKPI
jgi:glycosyltransferase involved in cell wall biosynthesis